MVSKNIQSPWRQIQDGKTQKVVHLKANKIPEDYKVTEIKLEDIWVNEKEKLTFPDTVSERYLVLEKSIPEKGMANPVPIYEHKEKYYFSSGMLRLTYAYRNNYTSIDCIVSRDLRDLKELQIMFSKTESEHFPEHLVDRWWDTKQTYNQQRRKRRVRVS